MKQLLVHSLVVSPLVRWITSPSRRWTRRTGINLAIIALILIALIQLKRMEVNCYDLLEVEKSATSADISKAFRRQSVKYHPDRVGQESTPYPFGFENAQSIFIQVQKCSEILSDKKKVEQYNIFGDVKYALKNEAVMFPVMAMFSFIGYLVHFIVCTVLTASNESKSGRYWITCFLVFAFTSEMHMTFLNSPDLFSQIPYLGSRLVFEQIQILKDLIPSVLSSGLLLSQMMYSNDCEMINHVLRTVRDSNLEIVKFAQTDRTGPAPVPAAVKLVTGVPAAPVQAAPEQPKANTNSPGYFSIQKIFQWLFYAYIAKMIYNMIRSMI